MLSIGCAALVFFTSNHSALAQATTQPAVVVTAAPPPGVGAYEEVPSAYGAPPEFSRSRFSNAVNAYVLPPWAFFFGELFEGQGFRHGPPDYLFTQEIEMGLPYRFNIAAESQWERFNGGGGAQTVSLEARWALADWNKIPLNPTIFAEYKFGVGTIRHEEVPPPWGQEEKRGGGRGRPAQSSRRLRSSFASRPGFRRTRRMGHELVLRKRKYGRSRTGMGFSQAIMTPILLPNERLKVGIEMEYKNTTVKDTRGDPLHSFTIGPTVAWKPLAHTRLESRPCSVAPRVLRLLMYLWPSPGCSAAKVPKPRRQYPRVSVISPMSPTPVPARIREKK